MSIEVQVSSGVRARHPEIVVRGFEVKGLRSVARVLHPPSSDEVRSALDTAGVQLQTLADTPEIREWRDAIAQCGLKPSRYKSSAEALARRWLAGGDVVTPLTAVNTYCAISAAHLAPLGGYDLGRLPAPAISLRLADPATDTFQPLGGRPEDMPLSSDVVVYASDRTVLCYAFNHRDSRETCLTSDTDEAIFLGEAVSAGQALRLGTALDQLRDLVVAAGGKTGPVNSYS